MYFEELVKKISPKLKQITFKLSRYLVSIGQDDLYQQAMIHLWDNFNAGKLQDKTDSYILQGCFFYLKNYIRKNCKRVKITSMDEPYPDHGDDFLEIEDKRFLFYRDELNSKLIVEAIMNNGLAPREKEILRFCAQGLTTRQIGERFGVSHVAIVKSLAAIRIKCYKYLDR